MEITRAQIGSMETDLLIHLREEYLSELLLFEVGSEEYIIRYTKGGLITAELISRNELDWKMI